MSSILDKFEVCDQIPCHLKCNIQYIHVFDDDFGHNALFMTTRDMCYGMGANTYGTVGLGHNKKVVSEELIPELCRQKCHRIINGMDFAIALTGDGQVYAWGENDRAQVARRACDGHLKPKLVAGLRDLDILDISCGFHHSLALTTDGNVYGWGRNSEGQVGVGGNRTMIEVPARLEFSNGLKVKAIYGYHYSSFALSIAGQVFSWGYNGNHHLGNDMYDCLGPKIPQRIINLVNIRTICPSDISPNIGVNEGKVYFCGNLVVKPKSLLCTSDDDCHQVSDLVSIPMALSKDNMIAILVNKEFYATDYHTFVDFYGSELRLTYETIKVNDSGEPVDRDVLGFFVNRIKQFSVNGAHHS